MGIRISQYQFDKICQQMEREFGKIKKGEEEKHTGMLFPMEGNLLKVYWQYPASNSRRLSEAIPLALFQIKSYLTRETYELDVFQSEDNQRLVHALLMAFDPFTNEELRKQLEQRDVIDLSNREELRAFYKEAVICLLRMRDSVQSWGKRMGSNGYFDFIESTIGATLPRDQEMKYGVLLPKK